MASLSKTRVFVGLHRRAGIATNDTADGLAHSRFHWTIWTEQKGSKVKGIWYQVSEPDWSAIKPTPDWWVYMCLCGFDCSDEHIQMQVRIMVGKMPREVTATHLYCLLQTLPVPKRRSGPAVEISDNLTEKPAASEEQNSATWIRGALELLQEKGWVEDVDIDDLMNYCAMVGREWCDGTLKDEVGKVNYTSRKM